MDIIVREALMVQKGGHASISKVVDAVATATNRVQGPLLRRVSGKTIIIGPLRAHACDFATILLEKVLGDDEVSSVVFLGNYIDGAHQSIEVVYLIALLVLYSGKEVIPLVGKHELLYPFQPENFGSLKHEFILRSLHTKESIESYERVFTCFFKTLPVVCIVNDRFFCVAGGPASRYRRVKDIEEEESQEALKEFVINEQMDEDEERLCDGSAFVAVQGAAVLEGFRFTFNAVCNFLIRNDLLAMVVGMEYHISRPDYDSFSKPNHYKESMYFPGYILGRINPQTNLPASITLFSAPGFCGINKNGACIAVTSESGLDIHEMRACRDRALITPGTQDHAFSWAQPMMERCITALLGQMVFGSLASEVEETEGGRGRSGSVENRVKEEEHRMASKMRRMCQLLKAHHLPLPEVPKL